MAFSFGNKYANYDTASSNAAIAAASVAVSSGQKVWAIGTYGSLTTLSSTLLPNSGSDVYAKAGSKVINVAGNDQTYEAWVCENPTPGTYTLSFTPGGTVPFRGIALFTINGLDTAQSTTIVSNQQLSPGTGSDAVTSGLLTPPAQPGGMLGFASDDNATSSGFTHGAGFTSQGVVTEWDASGSITLIETIAISSLSALAATFTAAATPGNDVTFAFYAPEPGGAGSSFPPVPGPGYFQPLLSLIAHP